MIALRFPSKKSAVYAALFCATLVSACILATTANAQSGSVNNPSFSCRAAPEGGIEELICRDRELSRQDRLMATAYSQARAAVRGSEGYGALYDTQQAFLRARAACVDLRTQKGYCVSDLTEKRISELGQWRRLGMDPNAAGRAPAKTGTTQSSRPPRGPSFDCRRASTVVERAICNDRSLSLLDRQMVEALAKANRAVPGMALRQIEREQREFLANRNQCARRTSDRTDCITVAYEMRIQRLGEWERGEE